MKNILHLISYGANIHIEVLLTKWVNPSLINGRYEINVYDLDGVKLSEYVRYGREQDAVSFAYGLYKSVLEL